MLSTIVVGLIATLVFELCPTIVISLFGTQSDLYMEFAVLTFRIFLMLVTLTCSIKVISIFFQAVGQPLKAAIVSLTRDIVCFVPLVIFLPKFNDLGVKGCLWAAPVADIIGIVVSIILVINFFKSLETNESEESKAKIQKSTKDVIVTIARQHGSQGKYIGELVAAYLKIPYYYKEMTAMAAKESGLAEDFISKLNSEENPIHSLYLSTTPVKYAIEAQDQIIKKIAEEGSCVIVGRAANYVLRDNKDLIKIYIYANQDYRVSKVMEMYVDTEKEALKNIKKSDKARSEYFKTISGLDWEGLSNYDLCIDSSIGSEETTKVIYDYIRERQGK